MATWQELYRQSGNEGQPVSDQNKITQTREQFLQKYANAIDANGRFIPGKANLWFDGENASDVYDKLIGKQTVQTHYGNLGGGIFKDETFFNPEVNMDWIEDPRAGGGWAGMKGAVLPGLAATAAIMGGQGLLGTGLGGGAAGASGASAFGGPGSITGANVLGAGDLALAAMPEVTASSLGLTGAQAAGAGATSGLLSAPTMGMPNLVGAGDLALTTAPQVTAATLGMPTGIASTLGGIGSAISGGLGAVNSVLGGNLGAIAGGLLGAAASGDTKTEATSQKDPWAPAQPYLKDNLKTNAALQAQYAQTPFNAQQQTAYQNSFNDSDNFRNNVAPGLLGMVNSFQPYVRQRTAVGQGGYAPAQGNSGLLSPNMQAPQGGNFGQVDWSQFLPKRA